jgi:hypothetical protein
MAAAICGMLRPRQVAITAWRLLLPIFCIKVLLAASDIMRPKKKPIHALGYESLNAKYGQSMRPRSRAPTRGLPNLFRLHEAAAHPTCRADGASGRSCLRHDSVAVGEDTPMRQPVEQLVALRSISRRGGEPRFTDRKQSLTPYSRSDILVSVASTNLRDAASPMTRTYML